MEAKMFPARKRRNQRGPSLYASKGDFCRIFGEHMSGLYLLSFLLTGDEAIAEQCFVGGLHIAQSDNLVFKEWAESWARRAIILNAIRMIRPRLSPADTRAESGRSGGEAAAEPSEITRIVRLPPFERFAFVMSVLEGYSDQECSLHLRCTRSEIRAARTRALEQLASWAELDRKVVDIVSGRAAQAGNSGSDLGLETVSELAASA
jgi:DNA-directed RNA polymerase specialized sigma24 family protein